MTLTANELKLSDIKSVHFIGVGGVGVGGIAELAIGLGLKVSGSDLSSNAVTERLIKQGATIYKGHAVQQLSSPDVVVRSSAVSDDNPEVAAAMQHNIPVIARAHMLALIMNAYDGIAISGTHGKTTTTGMVTDCLIAGGCDPTFAVGGTLRSKGVLAKLGTSNYMVVEADESDASLLYLSPKIAAVTNIDADHMDTYDDNFEQLKKTFIEFLHRLPNDGFAVLCADDDTVLELLPDVHCAYKTYGFSEKADVRVTNFSQTGFQSTFQVTGLPAFEGKTFTLNVPGKHNASNALVAIVIAEHLGVSFDSINKALSEFQGMGRRQQIIGDFEISNGTVTLIDDYGHHPKEIEVTLNALQAAWPDRRIVLAFQPHRYSRVKSLQEDFISALAQAPKLALLPIYAAGEDPIEGVTAKRMLDDIAKQAEQTPVMIQHLDSFTQELHPVLQDGDIVLLQGAGSIGSIARRFAANELSFV